MLRAVPALNKSMNMRFCLMGVGGFQPAVPDRVVIALVARFGDTLI
jgi:hypothetical protein